MVWVPEGREAIWEEHLGTPLPRMHRWSCTLAGWPQLQRVSLSLRALSRRR